MRKILLTLALPGECDGGPKVDGCVVAVSAVVGSDGREEDVHRIRPVLVP